MLHEGELPLLVPIPLFKPVQDGVDLLRCLGELGIVKVREPGDRPELADCLPIIAL